MRGKRLDLMMDDPDEMNSLDNQIGYTPRRSPKQVANPILNSESHENSQQTPETHYNFGKGSYFQRNFAKRMPKQEAQTPEVAKIEPAPAKEKIPATVSKPLTEGPPVTTPVYQQNRLQPNPTPIITSTQFSDDDGDADVEDNDDPTKRDKLLQEKKQKQSKKSKHSHKNIPDPEKPAFSSQSSAIQIKYPQIGQSASADLGPNSTTPKEEEKRSPSPAKETKPQENQPKFQEAPKSLYNPQISRENQRTLDALPKLPEPKRRPSLARLPIVPIGMSKSSLNSPVQKSPPPTPTQPASVYLNARDQPKAMTPLPDGSPQPTSSMQSMMAFKSSNNIPKSGYMNMANIAKQTGPSSLVPKSGTMPAFPDDESETDSHSTRKRTRSTRDARQFSRRDDNDFVEVLVPPNATSNVKEQSPRPFVDSQTLELSKKVPKIPIQPSSIDTFFSAAAYSISEAFSLPRIEMQGLTTASNSIRERSLGAVDAIGKLTGSVEGLEGCLSNTVFQLQCTSQKVTDVAQKSHSVCEKNDVLLDKLRTSAGGAVSFKMTLLQFVLRIVAVLYWVVMLAVTTAISPFSHIKRKKMSLQDAQEKMEAARENLRKARMMESESETDQGD